MLVLAGLCKGLWTGGLYAALTSPVTQEKFKVQHKRFVPGDRVALRVNFLSCKHKVTD